MKRWKKIVIGVVAAGAIAAIAGPFVYKWLNPAEDKATDQIDDLFAGATTAVTAATAAPVATTSDTVDNATSATTATNVTTAATTETTTGEAVAGVDGEWATITGGTVDSFYSGYRVDEVLNGVDVTVTGRTANVTGSLTLAGTAVTAAEISVDLASIETDQDRRDTQFRDNVMNVAEFPNATFTLTSPIDLGSVPAEGVQIEVNATGDMTLRGVTKSVTFPITAGLLNGQIVAAGEIPITFADYGVTPPSLGFVTVEDAGSIEFLLTFTKA